MPDLPRSFPRGLVDRWKQVSASVERVWAAEVRAGLPLTRVPDPGFAALAHGWAAGRDLGRLLGDTELSGGDFVRTVKSLVDLLRQIAGAAPLEATRQSAGEAADRLFRGVVEASSMPAGAPDQPRWPVPSNRPRAKPGESEDGAP